MPALSSPRVPSAHSTAQLRCDIVPDRDVVTIVVTGEIDLATAPGLDATLHELRAVGFATLRVDLRAVSFIDVAGVKLLWLWRQLAYQEGFAVTVDPGPVVERTLRLSELARLGFAA